MNCSTNTDLGKRIDEYAHYFFTCGWNFDLARHELSKGANFNKTDSDEESERKRKDILYKPRIAKPKKLAWVSTWDPRAPDKSKIIRQNLHLLYRNQENRKIFPEGLLIAANRRRQNLGEFIKPTIPRRFVDHGPFLEPGSFPCNGANIAPNRTGACDLCKHVNHTKSFKSPWDGRVWNMRHNVNCESPNIVYLLICNCDNHSEYAWYIGSSVNIKTRWRNHKSDFLNKKTSKCRFAQHANEHHPEVERYQPLNFISIIFLESVKNETNLLARETWWQYNVGTQFFGLNKRKDTRAVSIQKRRVCL